MARGRTLKPSFPNAIGNEYGRHNGCPVIRDSVAWLASMTRVLLPDDMHILDLFHLKEKVYDFAKNNFKNLEQEYVPWAERINSLLKNGDARNTKNTGADGRT